MTKPLAYEPITDTQYQILTRYNNEPWEHCDYASDYIEKKYLVHEYKLAYGNSFSFKSILLPKKYWPKK